MKIYDAIFGAICRVFHAHGRPINDTVRCLDCGREWPNPWAGKADAAELEVENA